MNTHDLKTWPAPFEAIRTGQKTCEVRKDDRGFAVGDILHLREWVPETGAYTGRAVRMAVTHKLEGFGLPAGICALSITPAPDLDTPGALIPVTADLLDRIKQSLDARMAEIDKVFPRLVEACPYDMKLAVAAWVIDNVAKIGIEGGSFRHLIYGLLGFGTDAYVPLYNAGGMTITNEFIITTPSPEDAAMAGRLRDMLWPKRAGEVVTMEGGKEPWTLVCQVTDRLEQLSAALAKEQEVRGAVQRELDALHGHGMIVPTSKGGVA